MLTGEFGGCLAEIADAETHGADPYSATDPRVSPHHLHHRGMLDCLCCRVCFDHPPPHYLPDARVMPHIYAAVERHSAPLLLMWYLAHYCGTMLTTVVPSSIKCLYVGASLSAQTNSVQNRLSFDASIISLRPHSGPRRDFE